MHKSITLDRLIEAVDRSHSSTDNPGFCTSCGEEAEGVEPDAEDYECASCGEMTMSGAEQLLIGLA